MRETKTEKIIEKEENYYNNYHMQLNNCGRRFANIF